jgi:hypothetical protein
MRDFPHFHSSDEHGESVENQIQVSHTSAARLLLFFSKNVKSRSGRWRGQK